MSDPERSAKIKMRNYTVLFHRHSQSTQPISEFEEVLRAKYRVIAEESDAGVYFIEAPETSSAEEIVDMLTPEDLESTDIILVLRLSTPDHAGAGGCGTGTLRILHSLK